MACLLSGCNDDIPAESTPQNAESTPKPDEHSHVWIDATCTAPRTCECGATEGEAKGHSYTATVIAPTCTEKGYTTYTCACGDSYKGDEKAALGHTEVTLPATASTCTESGLTEGKKCSVCGTVTVAQATVDALGHSWAEATCTAPKTCSVCKATEGEAKGHEYASTVTAPTCTEKGYTTYTCACGDTYKSDEKAALGHSWIDATCDTPKTCRVCKLTEGSPLDHVITEWTVAPTCTEKGYTFYSCDCGYEIVGNYTDPIGHSWTEATCTAPKTCSVCKATEGEAKGHDYTSTVTVPTCTEKGYTTHTCACGDTYTSDEKAALGHTEMTDAAKSPTCTEAGLTEGKHCSVCNAVIVAQTTLNALGHSWTDATCTTPKTCSICKTTEGTAKGHSYVATVIAPTCTEKGYTSYTCACGDTYTSDEVPALDHDFSVATCTDPQICKREGCGRLGERALGHDWVEATATTQKYCKREGCGKTHCEVNGHDFDAASCDEAGKCKNPNCNVSSGGAIGHDWVEATCIAPKYCKRANCGAIEGSPLGHSWTDATCITPKTCSVCKATEGEAKGHTEVTLPATAPTCTESGLTEGKKCSVCDTILEEQKTVEPAGHKSNSTTCAPPHTCTVCHTTLNETLHQWTTDTKTGIVICTRNGCKEVKDSEIPQDKNLVLGLSKIPIANPDMTEDELRDLVVSFMKLQINFAYRVDLKTYGSVYGYYIKNLYSSYGGSKNLANVMIKFEHGKYYGGIPYMGNAAGSLYRWLPFYDAQTGDMDWSPIIVSRREQWYDSKKKITYPDVGSAIFGNSCSSSCVWAWSRVTNEVNSFWTSGLIPANGYVKIGDYDLASGDVHGDSTKTLCKTNGEQKMYEAYAQMLRADGLVQSGHAAMIIADPVVKYNDDGSINGEESYVLIAEQKASFLTASPLAGGVDQYSPLNGNITYRIMGNYAGNVVNGSVKEMKRSFKNLFDDGFLPFTIPELVGQGEVERSTVSFSYSAPTIKVTDIAAQSASSNYLISDITFEVRNVAGELVFTACYANVSEHFSPNDLKTFPLTMAMTANQMYANGGYVGENLAKYTDGTYTIEILCRLSTGELISAYSGKLTK